MFFKALVAFFLKSGSFQDETKDDVLCIDLNCVGDLNELCVGAAEGVLNMSCTDLFILRFI